MRASLFAVALLALAGSALASLPLGDNGMTTYTGRKREANTLVFGNQMVVDQGVNAMLELTKQMLTGTWKATANDPATEKKEVRGPLPAAAAAAALGQGIQLGQLSGPRTRQHQHTCRQQKQASDA